MKTPLRTIGSAALLSVFVGSVAVAPLRSRASDAISRHPAGTGERISGAIVNAAAEEPIPAASASITVKVVSADGMPLLDEVVRLEAKDGRALLPRQGDSRPELPYRTEIAKIGMCTFGELDPGIFSVDTMQMGLSETVYHGGIPAISLEAGETKVVELKPADNRTSVKVKIEKDPYTVSKWAALLLLSRNPGLLTWAGKSFYHLEDECLARVMRYTLNSVPSDSSKRARWGAVVSSDDTYAFRNFPPGTYAVLAITWGKYEFEERPFEAAYIRGAKVELSSGSEKTVEIPWVEPEGPSPMNSRVFYDVVELQAKQYTAQELCDLLSDFLKKKTGSDARIAADPTVRQEKIALPQAKLQIWDLLEKVYLDKAWRLEPDYKNRILILRGVER